MRHLIVSLILLALRITATQGQEHRPEAMHHLQAVINPQILRLLPTDAQETTFGNAASIFGTRSVLMLDSTLTFLFDPSSAQDSSRHLRTVHEYPQPGQRIEWESYFDGTDWQPLQYTTLFADAQGRLLEALAMVWDPVLQDYVPDSRLLAWPHGQSAQDLDSFFVLQWNPDIQGWEVVLEHHFSYDQQDRLVEEWSTFQLFGELLTYRDVHSYDVYGDMILTEHFASFDGFEFMAAKTETTYADHRPAQRIRRTFDGMEFQNDGRELFSYDNQGLLMVQREYTWDPEYGGWHLNLETRYDYDTQGRIASRETSEVYDEFVAEKRITFSYAQDEQVAMEAEYTRPDPWTEWTLDLRTHYFYQGTSGIPTAPHPVLPLAIWPNPATASATVRLDTDAEVTLFDGMGRRVRSLQGSGDLVLDLQGLPAGVYQVLARQGQQWYQERLVKL